MYRLMIAYPISVLSVTVHQLHYPSIYFNGTRSLFITILSRKHRTDFPLSLSLSLFLSLARTSELKRRKEGKKEFERTREKGWKKEMKISTFCQVVEWIVNDPSVHADCAAITWNRFCARGLPSNRSQWVNFISRVFEFLRRVENFGIP